jgi:hypothetical protein
MLRDSVINFLEATIVLLALVNLVSIGVAAYSLALACSVDRTMSAARARDGVLVLLTGWMRIKK